jgi:hypothetical protein
MRLSTLYTSAFLAFVFGTPAHAAKNVEVVRNPTLFMMGEIAQAIGVSYSFAQHVTPNSTSSASALRESYSLSTVAAILNPHLVNLQILAGISYSQNFDDQTSTLLDGEYNIVASAFDMSYHPVLISSSRSTAVISNGYTPSYSLTSNSNQIAATLLSRELPIKVLYLHGTSQTNGLLTDTSSVSDAASLAMHHEYADVSETRFSLNHSRTQTGESMSSSYSASLGNFLSFDKLHRYRLASGLDIFHSKSGEVPQKNISIGEELSCGFGKALTGTFAERFTYNTTLDFDNNKQIMRNNTLSGSLSHTLYHSLTTSVSGSYGVGSVLGGTTTSYVANARMNYIKTLPAQSSMNLSVDGSRVIASQDLASSLFSVRDEPHLGVNWGDRIVPDVSGSLRSVVSVKSLSLDPLDPLAPPIEYVEGIDYEVDFVLGEIEILFGGGIVPGTDIAISYTTATDPSIRYQTDAISTALSLSMLAGRYTLSGNVAVQDQTLLSGESNNETLISSSTLNLRAIANFNPTQLGMEYSMLDSTQEQSSQFSVYGSHSLRTSANASIAFSLRDTYSMIEATEAGTEASNQNTLSLTASYSRKIFRWINFNTSLAAGDSRSGDRHSDFISLRGGLSGGYNQLQFSLNGQTLYRISGSGTTRDSYISCSITRYL